MLILAIVWIVCGVLAYGLQKNWCYQHKLQVYTPSDEMLCRYVFVLGPLGLFIAIMANIIFDRDIGLIFCMPKERCKRS